MEAELYKILWPILLTILSLALTIIGYFIKDIRQNLKDTQSKHEQEITKVRDDLTSLITSLPHTYVLRDDFLRVISCLEMKVDTIGRDVGELNKNVSRLVGGVHHEQ